MWSTEYNVDTDLPTDKVWAALRDWTTGAAPMASGDRRDLQGEFVVGAIIESVPEGLDLVLPTTILAITENELFEAVTPFSGLDLLERYTLKRLADGGTRLTRELHIDGDAEQAAVAGPRITEDYPEGLDDLLSVARNRN